MIALFDSVALPTLARAVLAVLFDLTLKGALILVLAGALTMLLKRASAATRHLVWCLALCSVLILPALTLTLPSWHLSILSEIPYLQEATAPLDQPATDQRSGDVAQVNASLTPVAPAVSPTAPEAAEAVREGATLDAQRPVHEVIIGTFFGLYEGALRVHWTLWLLGVWLGGVAVVLFRFFLGAAGVWWLAYRARPVRDPAWTCLGSEVKRSIGLRRRVRLLRSLRTAMPMTWGVLRPVVLLPVRVDDWTEARRRCVLTHEMAHVKRWDCLTQTLAQLACAINWFNPLVWMAARRMRHERELACDDFVLRGAVRPSDYASHLLEIARTMRTTLLAPLGAVAMAHPSQLEGRVLSILDAARKHNAVSRMATVAGVVFTAALVLPLAAMRPAHPDAPQPVFERVATEEGEEYRWVSRIDQGQVLDVRGVRGVVQATPSAGSEVEVVVLPRDDGFSGEVLVTEKEGAVVICLPHPEQPETCTTDSWHTVEMADQAEVDFVARVPEGVHFSGRTLNGNVTVVGLKSDVEALTAEGDIFVQATGRVEARAVEGDIKLRTASYGQARTVEGNIHARLGRTDWDGQLPFQSRDGDVTVELPGNAHTDIDLHVEADGHLQTVIDLRRHAREKGERFRGTLGRGGRLLAIHTVAGDITITHRGNQSLRPVERFDVRMRDDDRPVPRSRPRILADARSNAPRYAAAPRPSETEDDRTIEALVAERDFDADLDLLRLQIGQLDLALTTNLLDVVADALNEMDLGVKIGRQDLVKLAHVMEGDATFSRQLRRVGLEDFTRDELIMARLFGVDAEYVLSVQEVGYCPSLKELVAMKIAGVDMQYITEMASEGYEELPVADLVELRKSGVDRGVIHEMEEHGIHTPTVEEMVEYQTSHGPVPH